MLCRWRGRARCLVLSSGVRIECGGVSFVAEGQVGGVSSEAARKAYPDNRREARIRREAFDAGAVEALNAAIERAQRTGFWSDAIDALFELRDEWVVGQ